MGEKNIDLKKIVLSILMAVLITIQLSGCAVDAGKEFRSTIDSGRMFKGLLAMVREVGDKVEESLTMLEESGGDDSGEEGKIDLTKIYDPELFADIDNMTVKPTDKMYETLGLFGINEETHDVDMVMEGVMYEVLMNSETITSADIEAAIKGYGETYRKVEDVASGEKGTETQPQEVSQEVSGNVGEPQEVLQEASGNGWEPFVFDHSKSYEENYPIWLENYNVCPYPEVDWDGDGILDTKIDELGIQYMKPMTPEAWNELMSRSTGTLIGR